jgi:hypothetical protein
MTTVIFMAGNLREGYKCYGPFDDYGSAFMFADETGLDGWVMTLNSHIELLSEAQIKKLEVDELEME